MNFLGLDFILFFGVVAVSVHILPVRLKPLVLLLASFFFYFTANPCYLGLLVLSIAGDYVLGLGLGKPWSLARKRGLLLAGLFFNLGLLLVFKYIKFFASLFTAHPDSLSLLIPLGISYYVFKKISYLIDVYRGHIQPEKNFIRLALYVSFFPGIVAGPIDRAPGLLPQFIQKTGIDTVRLSEGAQLILWGLFKKLVIADRLGLGVDRVFAGPGAYPGPEIALAVFFYAFQVYGDFSGYTDIARGLARILGISLMENFRQPYLAESIQEFWQRWHISLSTWFRDYLFLPLSYALTRRFDRLRSFTLKADRWAYGLAVVLTMTLCGLWHGAALTFICWGALHGLFLLVSLVTRKTRKKLSRALGFNRHKRARKAFRVMVTFFMVTSAWIFFRATSPGGALDMISRLFSPAIIQPTPGGTGPGWLGFSPVEFLIAVLGIAILLAVDIFLEKRDLGQLLAKRPVWLRWAICYLVIFSILVFGIFRQTEFIYGRF